jgi:putative FmdB family regulatory protein
MPNYPFVCKDCKKRFQITLSYDQYGETVVHCPHCKSENVQRRISRVRMLRSESSRLDWQSPEDIEKDLPDLGDEF